MQYSILPLLAWEDVLTFIEKLSGGRHMEIALRSRLGCTEPDMILAKPLLPSLQISSMSIKCPSHFVSGIVGVKGLGEG